MKAKITFTDGFDEVTHVVEISELSKYVKMLIKNGWDFSKMTIRVTNY